MRRVHRPRAPSPLHPSPRVSPSLSSPDRGRTIICSGRPLNLSIRPSVRRPRDNESFWRRGFNVNMNAESEIVICLLVCPNTEGRDEAGVAWRSMVQTTREYDRVQTHVGDAARFRKGFKRIGMAMQVK